MNLVVTWVLNTAAGQRAGGDMGGRCLSRQGDTNEAHSHWLVAWMVRRYLRRYYATYGGTSDPTQRVGPTPT
jgi:hypothetical protein